MLLQSVLFIEYIRGQLQEDIKKELGNEINRKNADVRQRAHNAVDEICDKCQPQIPFIGTKPTLEEKQSSHTSINEDRGIFVTFIIKSYKYAIALILIIIEIYLTWYLIIKIKELFSLYKEIYK